MSTLRPRESEAMKVGAVLFGGFDLLDAFGPLEMVALLPSRFEIALVGPRTGPVKSQQGPSVHADVAYADAGPFDALLVPGGAGTRSVVNDDGFLSWLTEAAAPTEFVLSVCTGAAVLAAAGLLDGYRATTNKRAFDWVAEHGNQVEWVREARWIEDRDRWSSSGVAAGVDMGLAFIAHLHGTGLAQQLADVTEHDWHHDPSWDPYAAKNGLV